jgi:hypothetical protein
MNKPRPQILNLAVNFKLIQKTLKGNVENYNKPISTVATETDGSKSLSGHESEPVSSISDPCHLYP